MSRTTGSRPRDDLALSRAQRGVVGEAGRDERLRERRRVGRARAHRARRCASAGPPRTAVKVSPRHRVVDDAGERAVRVAHRDADRPLRDPVEEVDRAVERVDDPAQPARARLVGALLLGEERVAGAALARSARGSRAATRGRPR